MKDKGFITHLRTFVTALSLVNLVWVFGERLIAAGTALPSFLAQESVQLRLWVSVAVFAGVGGFSLVHYMVKSRDLALDFDEGANRNKVWALVFAGLGLVLATVVGATLLVFG